MGGDKPRPAPADAAEAGLAPPRARFAWCLFDWASSGFPTVIVTFVFSAYFARAVAESTIQGTAQWGYALSLSALAVAFLSPVLGAIADRGGRRKPWLAAFVAICVTATASLWFILPDPAYALAALVIVAIANAAFEIGMVFYNAMLPALAPAARMGRLSGRGWALGYAGGLCCLLVALFAFVQADPPLFGLDRDAAEHIRAAAPLVGLWFALFSIPLFVMTPDAARAGLSPLQSIRQGLHRLAETMRELRQFANIGRFLIARLFYTDGLNTLFAFGGIYAAGTFGMEVAEIIYFGIALNVTAGLGAFAFAWVDDRIGAKRTVMIALAAMLALGVPLLLVETKAWFWGLALALGVFMGPTQAASRSLMGRLAPVDKRTEMFGLFALSGRITAFAGPALLAWVTVAMGSQRFGMATVLVFLMVGLVLLIPVREPEG